MSVKPDQRYGLQLRKLEHGGFLVLHPDMYEHGSLWFAATTIDEAFEFMRRVLVLPSIPAGSEQN